MADASRLDIASMLTEVGVRAGDANPRMSVGHLEMLRSEKSRAEIPAYNPGRRGGNVTLGKLIAEGSFDATYEGRQNSMRRAVIVRTVTPHHPHPSAPARILSEAWMLGGLEHPNIPVVYGVGKDDAGNPLVILRATATATMAAILNTPDHPLDVPRGLDPVEYNVRRMLGICHALEHAHERGVIHRDIKPDHILVGRDGAVYLDGWTLAVALSDDLSGRFPLAAEQKKIAGTPAYMAPELATKDFRAVGPATDVYLVAATLHHVLTGRPRHLGENVFDAFYSAVRSEPIDYEGLLSTELGAVLNRAMSAKPSARHGSMREFRLALEATLRHAPSTRLTQRGQDAAMEFETALGAGADDAVVRETFSTTYTLFHSALREWPRNEEARRRLQDLLQRMVRYEARQGFAERATELIERLDAPSAQLRALVADAGKTRRPSTPPQPASSLRAARTAFTACICVVWTVFPLAFLALRHADVLQPSLRALQIGAALAWMVVIAVVAALGRPLFADLRNRAILVPSGVIVLASFAIQFYAVQLDVAAMSVVNLHHLLFFIVSAQLAAALDIRLGITALAYLIAFVGSAISPDYTLHLMALSNGVGLGYSTWFSWAHHERIERMMSS